MNVTPSSPMLTVREVTGLLNVSKQHVHNLIKRGELCAYRVGEAVRVKQSDLDTYLSEVRIQSQEED